MRFKSCISFVFLFAFACVASASASAAARSVDPLSYAEVDAASVPASSTRISSIASSSSHTVSSSGSGSAASSSQDASSTSTTTTAATAGGTTVYASALSGAVRSAHSSFGLGSTAVLAGLVSVIIGGGAWVTL